MDLTSDRGLQLRWSSETTCGREFATTGLYVCVSCKSALNILFVSDYYLVKTLRFCRSSSKLLCVAPIVPRPGLYQITVQVDGYKKTFQNKINYFPLPSAQVNGGPVQSFERWMIFLACNSLPSYWYQLIFCTWRLGFLFRDSAAFCEAHILDCRTGFWSFSCPYKNVRNVLSVALSLEFQVEFANYEQLEAAVMFFAHASFCVRRWHHIFKSWKQTHTRYLYQNL